MAAAALAVLAATAARAPRPYWRGQSAWPDRKSTTWTVATRKRTPTTTMATTHSRSLSKPRQGAFTFHQVSHHMPTFIDKIVTNHLLSLTKYESELFMKLPSLSVEMPKNMTMDSRLEYRFGQSGAGSGGGGGNHSSSSSHSPTKESLKNSER